VATFSTLSAFAFFAFSLASALLSYVQHLTRKAPRWERLHSSWNLYDSHGWGQHLLSDVRGA